MIDEKKLIEKLKEYKIDNITINGKSIIDIIDEQPKADKWIPCEERLPSEEGNYCVTRENGEVDIDCFLIWANGGSFNNSYGETSDEKVIAWQTLPQPYKKEGAE